MVNNNKKNLSELYTSVLSLVAEGNVGLAADIDGTLSQIAPTPNAAFIADAVRATLSQLQASQRLEVLAVVTGRAVMEARQLVGLPDLFYIGNHGLEMLRPGSHKSEPVATARPYQALIASVLETVKTNLPHSQEDDWRECLIFEDKGVTASIHYRLCPDPQLARQLILQQVEEIATLTGLRVSEGRMVVELRPPLEVNKGTALIDLAEAYQLKSLIYLGDDVTDVDGFRALRRLEIRSHEIHQASPDNISNFRGLAIGVSSPEMPNVVAENSDFLVEGVAGVEQFLSWLNEAIQLA